MSMLSYDEWTEIDWSLTALYGPEFEMDMLQEKLRELERRSRKPGLKRLRKARLRHMRKFRIALQARILSQ